MKHFLVSFCVAMFSFFKIPVKAAQKTLTRFADTTATTVRNAADTLSSHADQLADQFVDFAKTFIGTPYLWGSVNPKVGLDCSGFVNVVSNHFGIDVPRASYQFTNLGLEVKPENARTGDIILFTGSNAKQRKVGHMGIVTENVGDHLSFIHSSSGHKRGVHISELAGYYKTRLIKIIRLFPVNDLKVAA